ncbi:hypothetical protein CH373_04770 [Leptospira perolatii]|uniref:Tetratricopeptide repeat protein n=1 Tax=Leptospira perolatii TaxID=2023191 RepID=A0A2M9ZQI5_9LEPT|nr:tetratricopeptide repeat protein [Leptospira perolatii]PJZ68304.1 hypothetical protein CH360_16825 [Leptospira perolatii]PJZ74229.1 hypothetical protein CH373_04770 [Leptospira perolatii]
MKLVLLPILFLGISFGLQADPSLEAIHHAFAKRSVFSERDQAVHYGVLGNIYQKSGNYLEAIAQYDKSLHIKIRIGEKYTKSFALILHLKSISLERLGRFCDAFHSIHEAIRIYQAIEDWQSATLAEQEMVHMGGCVPADSLGSSSVH